MHALNATSGDGTSKEATRVFESQEEEEKEGEEKILH